MIPRVKTRRQQVMGATLQQLIDQQPASSSSPTVAPTTSVPLPDLYTTVSIPASTTTTNETTSTETTRTHTTGTLLPFVFDNSPTAAPTSLANVTTTSNETKIVCAVGPYGYHRHCQGPVPENSTNVVGTLVVQGDDDTLLAQQVPCVADSNGNFGASTGPFMEQILYQYQIQTTLTMTPQLLNAGVLKGLETALSNLLVPDLFQAGQCTAVRRQLWGDQEQVIATPPTTTNHHHHHDEPPPRNAPFSHVRRQRQLQAASLPTVAPSTITASSSSLTGLQAAPPDVLAPGIAGGMYPAIVWDCVWSRDTLSIV